jgi:hypothetical protein
MVVVVAIAAKTTIISRRGWGVRGAEVSAAPHGAVTGTDRVDRRAVGGLGERAVDVELVPGH